MVAGRSFFDLLTEPARAAFARARAEATGLGQPEVGPEHLLLGLLTAPADDGDPLAETLRAAGVTPDAVRALLRDELRNGPRDELRDGLRDQLRAGLLAGQRAGLPSPDGPSPDPGFSKASMEAIKRILHVVMTQNSPLIHPAHVFLALTAGRDGDAPAVPRDKPSDQPSDLPTDLPSDLPSDLPTDLPTSLLAALGADVDALRRAAETIAREDVAQGPRIVPLRGVERTRAVRMIVVSRLQVGSALLRYGRHHDGCPEEPCSCGFAEARAQAMEPLPALERLEPAPPSGSSSAPPSPPPQGSSSDSSSGSSSSTG